MPSFLVDTPVQYDLFGNAAAPQGMDIQDRVAYLLELHPECRDDDMALLFWYWTEFDGLGNVLLTLSDFQAWLTHNATHPETIRRRRCEVQNDRNRLRPSDTVADYRQKKAHAGPPRR